MSVSVITDCVFFVSVAAALVLGNYGLWNAYTLVTAFLHAPSPS